MVGNPGEPGEGTVFADMVLKPAHIFFHAMIRLDELWEENDFHRGDKMRINEVRAALKRIKEKLLDQQ